MNLSKIYLNNIPDFISQAANTKPMQRLKGVGMNCGCEYTNFHMYANKIYSRYEHSVGVALIIYKFTKDKKQALAGLFHDIATPAFSHVVDFLRGDYLKQESTEIGTSEIIQNDEDIQKLLNSLNLTTKDVDDYHKYPIADNDSPKLSADRLEYTLGNILNYGFGSEDKIREYYNDLEVGINEYQEEEIMFKTKDIAIDFANKALLCSNLYVADEDRFAMEALSNILKKALEEKIIVNSDLYLQESEIISKLTSHNKYAKLWKEYTSYYSVTTSKNKTLKGYKVFAKKRYINPYLKNNGRVKDISEDYKKQLENFLNKDFNYYIYGI